MNDTRFENVSLSRLVECHFNPRKHFDGPDFDELTASIAAKGVLTPLLVRPLEVKGEGKKGKVHDLEIVGGARRYRAACVVANDNGGMETFMVPAIIREMPDDEAFEVMTIENLLRKNLTELEEAEGFKLYIDRKGEGAAVELAEKTGINVTYIRRRVAVMGLPREALEAWDKGALKYGHLEQFLRITDPTEIKRLVKEIKSWGYSVQKIKDSIDQEAIKLGAAMFSTKEQGCAKCPHNSKVQKSLLDIDAAKGELCMDPSCFREAQRKFLTESWESTKLREQYKTNGFRFNEEINYPEYETFFNKPRMECRKCDKLVTVIYLSGKVSHGRACVGDKKCFNYKEEKEPKINEREKSMKAERRAEQHGTEFREEFYREQLPARVEEQIKSNPEKDARIKLFVLIKARTHLREWLANELNYHEPKHWLIGDEDIWDMLLKLSHTQLDEYLKRACINDAMRGEFGAEARKMVADHVGIDLKKEWRLTKEYLEKKTMAEIRAIAAEFKLFEQQKAKTFLFEVLLKKRGNFDSCKKGELIRVILESGVDLAGAVPGEILGLKPEKEKKKKRRTLNAELSTSNEGEVDQTVEDGDQKSEGGGKEGSEELLKQLYYEDPESFEPGSEAVGDE